ncbi:MAG: hypothetical protein QXG00_08630 [Candidatus Woesearchaeota archaeon]
MIIGVNSYINSDLRKQQHLIQLEWLKNLSSIVFLIYRDDYLTDYDYNSKFIVKTRNYNNAKCDPSDGRNIILEYFYSSNHDWLLLLDDDVIIDNSKSYIKFEEFEKNLSDGMPEFFTFNQPNLPGIGGWKNLNYITDKCYWFKSISPSSVRGSSGIIIRNYYKKYKLKLWFDRDLPCAEDIDFGCNYINTFKRKIYIFKNITINHLGEINSAYFKNNTVEYRRNLGYIGKDMISKKYPIFSFENNILSCTEKLVGKSNIYFNLNSLFN